MPLVISITLYKTESLRLDSDNDISSQFQVNITPKIKRHRTSDPAKKQAISADIRVTSLSDHGRFTALRQVSDTLQQICEIRGIRFQQSIDSSYRMQSIATRSQQLSSLIWKIQCYLRYTGNQIRLEDGTKLLSPNTTTASLHP